MIWYSEGGTQCDICLESRRRDGEKHGQELRDKQKYYNQNKEERAEYSQIYRQQYIECAVCNDKEIVV